MCKNKSSRVELFPQDEIAPVVLFGLGNSSSKESHPFIGDQSGKVPAVTKPGSSHSDQLPKTGIGTGLGLGSARLRHRLRRRRTGEPKSKRLRAEVAVLCITKSGEVLNYQAFTNSKGVYEVVETCRRASVGMRVYPGPSAASTAIARI
ncbi:hypothetical protein PHJA_000904600 [Phtheirospermum japonicum]|uniref:Uncharacterized protein n=1 Tax=Phtheirospermum japonicum TaxID=374723 RepID=A0A830BPH8_9LAMI|nr:hypothetical protein PHJA_000904600 [Phtheirospermum japonicum]